MVWRGRKKEFDTLRLCWDVGKSQIRHFCHLYTASATAEMKRTIKRMEGSVKDVEEQVIEL